MSGTDETPPVAEDDFPEFAAPPQQKPNLAAGAEKARAAEDEGTDAQKAVDEVIARLRQKRTDGA